MLEIKNLCKTYRRNQTKANIDINATIQEGDLVGLIGPNGSGKTTLVRQIVGLSKPTSGSIWLDGKLISDKGNKPSADIAFFNQKYMLLESHTAFEVVYFTGVYRGLSKAESQKQADYLIKYFDLEGSKDKTLWYMSGGQIKLVMLAAAFVGRSRYIILDEPTNDLDPENRERLWELIQVFNREHHTTFIIVSHNLAELESVVRTVLILKEGRVFDSGGIQEIKSKYSQHYKLVIRYESKGSAGNPEQLQKDGYALEPGQFSKLVAKGQVLMEAQRILPLVLEMNGELNVYRTSLVEIFKQLVSKEE